MNIRALTYGIVLLFGFLYSAGSVYAQVTYSQPLTNIPGITDPATLQSITDIGLIGFINGIIRFIFTAAATASFIMIVLIGFQYIVAEKSASGITILKGKITSVVWGIGLIGSTWIILNAINPTLVTNLNLFKTAPILTPPSTTNPATAFSPKRGAFNTYDEALVYLNSIQGKNCTAVIDTHHLGGGGSEFDGGVSNTVYEVYCKAPN